MDCYKQITDRIIQLLEQGVIPWQQPWTDCGGAVSHISGKPYSLLNQMLLGGEAGEYLTYQQAKREGGHVRAGEKGKAIIFWKITPKEDRQEDEDEQQEAASDGVPLLRIYTVFRIDQCEGIKPRKNDDSPGKKLQPDEHAEQIVAEYVRRSGVKLHVRRSSQASYSPSLDTITVPALSQYTDVAEYYSTLFHEITHSTGHCTRLNRPMSTVMFGSDNYSKEELIAELGSAYLVNACGLETAGSFRNSAGYIQGWLRALRDDKRFLVSAASKAEKAVDLIVDNNKQKTEIL